MAKDARLDLGRYVQNPFNRQGEIAKKLNFGDLFRSKPSTGDYPWNPSRFEAEDLTKRMMTRKQVLNPELNFVGNAPFFDDNKEVTPAYYLFGNLGKFARAEDYDFYEGRAQTAQRPQDQPDYDPQWMEAYKISPTVNPEKMAKNPMPRLKNPDPNGYLMRMAEGQVKSDMGEDLSVASLMNRQSQVMSEQKKAEDKQGEKIADNNEDDTNISPGKTLA